MSANALPQALLDHPLLSTWIGFEEPGQVRVSTGKVEIGQGVLTALAQIAADELGVDITSIRMRAGETQGGPDEGFTAGSLSIETGGAAVRLAGAEMRALLLAAAARRLAAPAELLDLAGGFVMRDGEATSLDLWAVAPELDPAARVTGEAPTRRAAERRWVGRPEPRIDLPAKVFGAGFIHDLAPPGLLHARILHRPWPGARLASEMAAIRAAAGPGVEVERDGDVVMLIASDEAAVATSIQRLREAAAWEGGEPIAPEHADPAWLVGQPGETRVLGAVELPEPGPSAIVATYSRPYLAHASIGPSCALARYADGTLELWTHSQGVFPLRDSLARVLGLPSERVVVRHVAGAGCYGHNGADDVALDAALVAMRRPGLPVRVLWMREDELGISPVGAAMTVRLAADLAPDGRLRGWTVELWSPTHVQRPGAHGEVHLATAEALGRPTPRPAGRDVPDERGGGAVRNALSLYDIPQRVVHHHVPRLPLRTSALRSLGAFANVFAIESFVDELAAAAGQDPVAYRLALLSDPRARRVILHAAGMCGWADRPAGGSGRGLGLAFSRYKGRAGYAALAAEVEADREIRVTRVWCAVDAGLVINPDGAANQVEGGIVQAASWTLKEAVTVADGRISSVTWDQYPILTFSEVPEIAVAFVGSPDDPPLGLGEVAQGATAAAIGNAVAHALGVRLRHLPFTRERVEAALLAG